MIDAYMIDGFGSLPEETYRRTLLLFGKISYVYPPCLDGAMPFPWVLTRPDLAVEMPESDAETRRRRLERAREDSRP